MGIVDCSSFDEKLRGVGAFRGVDFCAAICRMFRGGSTGCLLPRKMGWFSFAGLSATVIRFGTAALYLLDPKEVPILVDETWDTGAILGSFG